MVRAVRKPRSSGTEAMTQQNWWLSATALSAGAYGLLLWLIGTFVISSWPLEGGTTLVPFAELSTTLTVVNGLWGVALLVDLLNALKSSGRARTAWVAGTVLAMGIVVLAQLSVSNMKLALGG